MPTRRSPDGRRAALPSVEPDRLQDALRRSGLPVTLQRRVVFGCLDGRIDHPTAEQVWEAAQKQAPGLSLTTVYRVLETLVTVGLVRKLEHPGSAARFDPRVDRHHHLVCVSCGTVADFELRRGESVRLPSVAESGFEISDYSIHFTGVCPKCQKRSTGRQQKRKEAP